MVIHAVFSFFLFRLGLDAVAAVELTIGGADGAVTAAKAAPQLLLQLEPEPLLRARPRTASEAAAAAADAEAVAEGARGPLLRREAAPASFEAFMEMAALVDGLGVWCGGHRADECGNCAVGTATKPKLEEAFHFCNGDCVWENTTQECLMRPELTWCGAHAAHSCTECPYSNATTFRGKSWCNGECYWLKDRLHTAGQCYQKYPGAPAVPALTTTQPVPTPPTTTTKKVTKLPDYLTRKPKESTIFSPYATESNITWPEGRVSLDNLEIPVVRFSSTRFGNLSSQPTVKEMLLKRNKGAMSSEDWFYKLFVLLRGTCLVFLGLMVYICFFRSSPIGDDDKPEAADEQPAPAAQAYNSDSD